jgi:arginyl-tRNA synthetase
MYTLEKARKEAIVSLKKTLGKKFSVSTDMLTTPPDATMGDLAFGCFALAKGQGRSPVEIATEMAAHLEPSSLISKISSAGPYVNFHLNKPNFASSVLADTAKLKKRYGNSLTGKGKKVLVEFANLNTHKEIHVGHLRNLALGEAVTRVLKAAGYDTTPIAYINDLGNNVARCLWGLKYLHPNEEPPVKKRLNFLGSVYSAAVNAIGENELKRAEVSSIQHELEDMKGEWVALWKQTQKWSADGLKQVYDEFGITLEHIYWEHELIDETQAVVKKLLTDGIAKMSQGAVIVDLEDENLSVNLLRKTDGTLLYNAKDIALAYRKEADYHADRSIIVVDTRQTLAFKQLSATLKRMGFPREVMHLGYDFVTLPEGAMSSRKGNIVSWEDLRDAMTEKLVSTTKERHEAWKEKKITVHAMTLTLAAIKFMMLRHDAERPIVFDMDEAMSVEGFTGPYLLYTIARIYSIETKADMPSLLLGEQLTHPLELMLLRSVADFPGVVAKAAATFQVSIVAQEAFALARTFAEYYHEVRILEDADHDRRGARLALIAAVRQTLMNGCELLGIETVKEM